MEPAIRTAGLTKRFGATVAIEDLDLTVAPGEVFGFLGPNGAGKTTTIRLLLDLIRPTSGDATVLGLDVRAQSLAVRARTGYLPGELRLPDRVTGRRFLRYMGRLRDASLAAEAERLAERLDLSLDRPVGELSKGNKQKVGIVAALAHRPQLAVLDEPTSGLDPIRQRVVQELIREHADGGRTVFLSSHALDQVEHVADRVGIVRDGRLVAVERVATLKARARRKVTVTFAAQPVAAAFAGLPGVTPLESDGRVLRFEVEGTMDELVKHLARYDVEYLTAEEPDLDDIFLAYYEEGA